jgi:hypothetical protein
MQVDINIKDAITPALERTRTALLDTKPILDDVAFAIETLLARHLRQTHATKLNRLGAPSTGFWQKAIASIRVKTGAKEATANLTPRRLLSGA